MNTTIHQSKPDHDGPFVIYWVRTDKHGKVRRSYYQKTSRGTFDFTGDSAKAKTYSTYANARRQKQRMHDQCRVAFQGTLWVASID